MRRARVYQKIPVDTKQEFEKYRLLFGSEEDPGDWLHVCFCGAHGTGKTTLLWEVYKFFKREIEIPMVPIVESSRDLLLDVNGEDYEIRLIRKRASLFNHFGHFISDRSLLDPLAYQKVVRGSINKELMEFAFKYTTQILFYVPIAIDLIGDGTRPTEIEYQKKVQDVLLKILTRSGKKYYSVTRTDLVERTEFVKHVIMDREGWRAKFKGR